MEGWLTTKQAAERLGVTHGRVRQMIADGEIPSEKMGQSRLIREQDLRLVENRPGRGRPRNKTKKGAA